MDSNTCWRLSKRAIRVLMRRFFCLSLAVIDPLHARYLIAHKIASGGFGHVYAGVRKKDGMPVALKVVPKPRMTELSTVRGSRRNNTPAVLFSFSRKANCHSKLSYFDASLKLRTSFTCWNILCTMNSSSSSSSGPSTAAISTISSRLVRAVSTSVWRETSSSKFFKFSRTSTRAK